MTARPCACLQLPATSLMGRGGRHRDSGNKI